MFISSLVSSKALLAATATGLVALGGGAAAYAGALPAGLQTVAHTTFGAPAADQPTDEPTETPSSTDTSSSSPSQTPSDEASPSDSASPVGPDATGPAAFGLCNAYLHGGLAPNSIAYRNLMTASGTDGIDAYCATVVRPGMPTTESTTQPTDQPMPVQTAVPGHSTGRPTWAPVGPPSHPRH